MTDYEQQENIERVAGRIDEAILNFWQGKLFGPDKQFHAADLHECVETMSAPASADRILRRLRQQKKLNYRIVSRSQSLYEALPL